MDGEVPTETSTAGISQKTLERILTDIEDPLAKVIVLDRKQPELTQTVEEYVSTRVNNQRITEGRRMLRRRPGWAGSRSATGCRGALS